MSVGEDVDELVNCVARAIVVKPDRDTMAIAHRLRRYAKRHVHPPIIVQFTSRSVKESWLMAARPRRGLKASYIAPSFQTTEVYLNEHLTSSNEAFLGRARRLFRERRLVYAALSKGKVPVRRREGEVLQVTAMDQLDVFEK